MSDFHYDLVSDYLDGELSTEAWEIACKTHGPALEAALQEEHAVRQQIAATPSVAMPAALREQLLAIPNEHRIQNDHDVRAHEKTTEGGAVQQPNTTTNTATSDSNEKRTLLFPIISSFVALAACLALVMSAIFLSPEPMPIDNALAMHDAEAPDSIPGDLHADAATLDKRQDLGANHKKHSAALKPDNKADLSTFSAAALDSAAASENAAASESGALEIEVLEEQAPSIKAEKDQLALNDRPASASTLPRERNEGRRAASRLSTASAPANASVQAPQSPVLAAADSDDAPAISEDEMDAALAEARHNTQHHEKLRSLAKAKNESAGLKETAAENR